MKGGVSNFSVRRYHAKGKRTGIDKTMAQFEDASNSMTDFASFLEGKLYFKIILKHLHDDCRFTVHNRGQIGVYLRCLGAFEVRALFSVHLILT